MSNTLQVYSGQSSRSVNSRLLQSIVRTLLTELLRRPGTFTLEINIVAAPEMTRLNETFLRHRGSTDVLAFDYRNPSAEMSLCGEIFVCTDEAIIQAARFRTTWQSELVRYVVHGILHLTGYDDHIPGDRRKMKAKETQLVKELASRFEFSDLDEGFGGASGSPGPRNLKPRGRVPRPTLRNQKD